VLVHILLICGFHVVHLTVFLLFVSSEISPIFVSFVFYYIFLVPLFCALL
jgi:hypothetical protein